LSEDNNYLQAGYEKHEKFEKIFIDWQTVIDQPEVAFLKKAQFRLQKKFY